MRGSTRRRSSGISRRCASRPHPPADRVEHTRASRSFPLPNAASFPPDSRGDRLTVRARSSPRRARAEILATARLPPLASDRAGVPSPGSSQTLAEIAGDASLVAFRGEYEKLHAAFASSLASERSLTQKCRDLNAEVVENATKVQTALRLSEDDQATINGLKQEIEQAWKLVDATKEKEARTAASVDALKTEMANLERAAESGADVSTEKDEEIKQLMQVKHALVSERDDQVTQIVSLRDEVMSVGAQLRSAEAERARAEAALAAAADAAEARAAEAEREARAKERLEKAIVDLKHELELKANEVKTKTGSLKDGEEHVKKLRAMLDEQRETTRRARKSHDALDEKANRLESELREQRRANAALQAECEQCRADVRERVNESERAVSETARVNKVRDGALNKLRAAEKARGDAESALDDSRRAVAELERDAEAQRKHAESDRKARDELKRELDVLAKLKSQAESATQKQVGLTRVNENSKKNLEREVSGYKSEAQRQAKALYALETQREKFASEASATHVKHLEALEEMKLRELENVDLLKQIADGESKLRQQQNLYEAVRADRNAYSKNLVAAQDEISEMKRKFKIMNQQVEQLKEEIGAKDIALVKEHFDHMKVEKEKEGLRFELAKAAQATADAERAAATKKAEVGGLERVVAEAAAERETLRKEHDIVVADRDVLGTQLVRRNDELALLYEKIKIQQSILNKGQLQYRERLDELRVLKVKLGDGARELGVLKSSFGNVDALKREVHRLGRELLQERTKVKALSEELENPLNVHRWRALEGSDPATFEMIQKIQTLQRRLVAKTEETAEKDALIAEKERLYGELKKILARQPGPELAEQLSVYQQNLREKNRQLKSVASELNLYRGKSDDAQMEIERLTRELNELKRKYYETKRREQLERSREYADPELVVAPHPVSQKRFAGGGFGFA